MKKLINTSFIYAILAMIGGVFYREFTKFNNFTQKTTLSFVHLHLFVLGMFFFLILTIFEDRYSLTLHKSFSKFYIIYNTGMAITVTMFICRGIIQVLGTPLSNGMTAAISGISGIGHLAIGAGIIWFFIILKKQVLK